MIIFLQAYRTGDMAWWEKIADFWWGEGWEEWLVFSTSFILELANNALCTFLYWKPTKQYVFYQEVLVCLSSPKHCDIF